MCKYIYTQKGTHAHTFIDLPLGRSMRVAYILRLNLVLTYGVPLEFRGGFHLFSFKTAIRHRVSPEFIGSRNCVPMAFTAESLLARGQ